MSDLVVCSECGHIRYDDDMHNGHCTACEAWAENTIRALRTDVAEAMALVLSHEGHIEKLVEQVAALKAKLDEFSHQYESPLTEEEAGKVWAEWMRTLPADSPAGNVGLWDAAIRQVRRERGTIA